jgi:hypothetical protein
VPYKSKSQQRYMYAAEERGDVEEGTASRWSKETKDVKGLPERVKAKKAAYARMRRTGGSESP